MSVRRWILPLACLWYLLLSTAAWAAQPSPIPISGKILGQEWQQADPAAKLAYCEKAYNSFRSSPSQSYIISSNVQAITPEGFCQRLDQFYSYEVNEDTPLGRASALAPLLFADQPL